MLQKFPAHIPFATEENWNIVDRQVVNREIEFTLEDGTVVYPHTSTEGRDFNTPLPEIDSDLYSKIYSSIEDKINHAGIKLTPTASLFGSMTAYNHKNNEITYDPQHPSREILIVTLFVSYLYSFFFTPEDQPDVEDKINLDRCITVAIFWQLKQLGFDMGDYGLNSIAMSFPNYSEYMENDYQIEELLSLLQ